MGARRGLLLAIYAFSALLLASPAAATDRYFSSSASCPGSGTSGAPYCALTSANSIDFAPGDRLLLNRGSLWTGQQLQFQDSDDGSAVSWITVDAYGSGARPILDWTKASGQKLITGLNVDYMAVQNLEVREAQIGVDFDYTTIGHNGLRFENLYIHDMFYDASDGTIWDGAALYVNADGAPPTGTNYYINNITLTALEAKNTAYAPGLAYGDPACPSDECDAGDPFQNVTITNNYFHDIEGATSVQDIDNLTMTGNWFVNIATVTQTVGTTNVFFWHTSDANVANNVFDTIPDTNSFDQSHVDLEGWTSNADFRHNYFTNAAGNAFEFQLWHSGSYLTGIDIDSNVFNRNSFDTSTTYNGAIAHIPNPTCVISPSGTIANTLYYEPDGLLDSNGCSDNITETANTDVGSSALFAIGAKDFSTVQGTNNWRYRYSTDTGSTWTDLGYYNAGYDNTLDDRWQINSSTTNPYVTRFRMDTGSTTSSVVAREWKAPSAGTINIRSRPLKYETGGDGVHARITKNGTQIWPGSGWQLIGANDQVGVAANWSGTVAVNDLIRFELKNNANNSKDNTIWMPMITYPPAGGGGTTYIASTGFSGTQGANQWSYKKAAIGVYSYSNMASYDSSPPWWEESTSQPPWTLIAASWQHPGGSNDSVRTWTAPSAGTVTITSNGGNVRLNQTPNDGTTASILKNTSSTTYWSANILDQTGVDMGTVGPITVASGDQIHFRVNKRSNESNDATLWDPKIVHSP